VFPELVDDAARLFPDAFRAALDPSTLADVDEHAKDALTVLELGCGVGNSAYPLLRANENLKVVAVDCSKTAIEALKANPEYDARRVRAHVVDASREGSLVGTVEDGTLDAATAVFFFSALTRQGLENAAKEIARTLKRGGVLLFRDYARGDVKGAEGSAFVPGYRVKASAESGAEEEAMFRRSDGTLAKFFDEEELARVFDACGFEGSCEIVEHLVTNRKLDITMSRKFVQGRFVKVT
jgi:SAM-dependent methyltransferase